MSSLKPRIGITLDFVNTDTTPEGKWYTRESWYALRYRYATAVAECGGIPLAVTYQHDLIADYVDHLDGLLVTGGGFDVLPEMYGAIDIHHTVTVKPERTFFERDLCQAFLDANKPVLGICGGMQLLNVLFSGTLFQHLPDDLNGKSDIEHSPKITADKFAHTIDVATNRKLLPCLQDNQYQVNSVHHQGVAILGKNLNTLAYSSDHLVEAFESVVHDYVLGVQWHPEFLLSELDTEIFKTFIQSSLLKR